MKSKITIDEGITDMQMKRIEKCMWTEEVWNEVSEPVDSIVVSVGLDVLVNINVLVNYRRGIGAL